MHPIRAGPLESCAIKDVILCVDARRNMYGERGMANVALLHAFPIVREWCNSEEAHEDMGLKRVVGHDAKAP